MCTKLYILLIFYKISIIVSITFEGEKKIGDVKKVKSTESVILVLLARIKCKTIFITDGNKINNYYEINANSN